MNLKVTTEIINPKTTKHRILLDNEPISYSMWITNMQASTDFILTFNQALVNSKFDAFFWEVKPIDGSKLNDTFEFVLVNSLALLEIEQDETTFSKYFDEAKMVVDFPNIRGDAELVVPTPFSEQAEYAHLAKFIRTAEEEQVIAFWKMVAKTYGEKIGSGTKWLSTSGLGVYWLHVRIDCRPKYYQHSEYRNI